MAIGDMFRFLAELLGFVNRRTDLQNTEPMKRAKESQLAADERDRIERDTAKRDEEAARRNYSE